MTIEFDKLAEADATRGCCGGKSAGDHKAAPTAIKADDVKAKPKNPMGACCGGATAADAGREHAAHD